MKPAVIELQKYRKHVNFVQPSADLWDKNRAGTSRRVI